ncbi:efflux transporter outer membrane subunit [Undibacterium rugosum]|uniref:efflux transporter outer membrane subunit n=1 Tax=Undibacterium rugosum TaxID=2762291 RepID=UPI001B81ECAF|nr:efflux transporter outer membrane subunit [Undibacterium rugosum]MBR7779352.1 efflux transporter outer membrane subunit [Undibacterium rugosum]
MKQTFNISPVRLSLIATSLSAALLLSACADFSGIKEQATEIKVSLSGQTESVRWPDASWSEELGGSQLSQLIQNALKDNPGIQLAATRITNARALQDQFAADRQISLTGNAESTYQRFTKNGMVPPPLAGSSESNNQATVNLSYELDFWGKHQAQSRVGLSTEQAAKAETESAKLLLSNAIARQWVQLQKQAGQLTLTEQQLKLRKEWDSLIQQRLKAGLDNRSELQQNLVSVANLQSEVLNWREAIAQTKLQLALLAGQTPEYANSIATPVTSRTVDFHLPSELPLDLISRKPEIIAAKWRIEAMRGEVELAKNRFYRNINLVGFAGLSSLGLDKLLKSDSTIMGVGPAIHLPLFEGGRLRAQLAGKVADTDSAVLQYNQTVLNALKDAAEQLQTLQSTSLQIVQQEQAQQAAQQVLTLNRQRFEIGTSNRLPVISAELALISQQKNMAELSARQLDARVNLIKALGGSYPATRQ